MLHRVLLLAAFAATVLETASAARKKSQKNFIIYQPDEMRAESLGCYGHPMDITPNFDKFAAGATRFDQAHVSYTGGKNAVTLLGKCHPLIPARNASV